MFCMWISRILLLQLYQNFTPYKNFEICQVPYLHGREISRPGHFLLWFTCKYFPFGSSLGGQNVLLNIGLHEEEF